MKKQKTQKPAISAATALRLQDEARANGAAVFSAGGNSLTLSLSRGTWVLDSTFVGVKKQRLTHRQVLAEVVQTLSAVAGKFEVRPTRDGARFTWEDRTTADDFAESIVDDVLGEMGE